MSTPANHLPRNELVRRVGVILQSDRPPVFSGSSADLGRWFDDVERGCDQNQIPSTQRAGAAILLLIFNGTPFRVIMQERNRNYLEQSNADYWPWGEFKTDLVSVVRAAEDTQNSGGDIDWARVGRIGLRVAQGALFVPLIGIATLNIIGFTAGGVLAGSAAAGLQSAIYGGATGGVFSVLQSIGATATLEAPVIMAGFSTATRWFGLGGSGNEPSDGSGGGGPPPNPGRRPTPPTASGDEPASSPSNNGIADASPPQPQVTAEAEAEVESRMVRYGPCHRPTKADSTARARKVVDDLNVNAVRGSDVVSARGIEGQWISIVFSTHDLARNFVVAANLSQNPPSVRGARALLLPPHQGIST